MAKPEHEAAWRKLAASMSGEEGKRWARPDEPILHNLNDEKEEPHTFFHNINYRTSRKYINVEKIKVTSNVDRGPLARKRDVNFIYTTERLNRLQKEAAELEVPYTLPHPKKA